MCQNWPAFESLLFLQTESIGFSEPKQNDHSCFYSEIILNFIIMLIIII